MRTIHPTAVIEKGATIGDGVEIGPYAIIGANCRIDDDTRIGSFAVCEGRLNIGKRCTIEHHVVLGTPPQDVSFQNEDTGIEVGDDTVIREFGTVHRATGLGQWTRIGQRCFIMAYCHIAHNCQIGHDVTMANGCGLSGYVEIEDRATISGLVGIHQFVRVGQLAMIGGLSKVVKDIPPFTLADGHPARIYGLNTVGMRRRGLGKDDRETIKKIYRMIGKSGTLSPENALLILETFPGLLAEAICKFYEVSKRGISRFSREDRSSIDVN